MKIGSVFPAKRIRISKKNNLGIHDKIQNLEKACPAGAISMVPYQYPKQQVKDEKVMQSLNNIFKSKTDQENIAYRLYEKSSSQVEKQFLKALIRSNRLLAEDTIREAGYMLPQSKNTNAFLKSLLDNSDEDFPKDAVNELLELLECNE